MKFLLLSLLLLTLTAVNAAPSGSKDHPFLSRQRSVCRSPRVICPGHGCIRCREVGPLLVRNLISLRTALTRGNPRFTALVNRFESFIQPGGRADFSSSIFRRDCCLRIFGTQVAQEVPSLIAYGYLGRAVYPGAFLSGFAGFQKQNEGATIREFVEFLGRDFRGEFFGMCRVAGIFEIPCLRGPLTALREPLVESALLNNIEHENAAAIGLAAGQSIGAFTSNELLVSRSIRAEVRSFLIFELKRCCPRS